MNVDFIAFTAHPDDAELGMGGTIAKMINENKKGGIIDFTQGELGTRGTEETRKQEAEDASKILNLTFRDNLQIPDGKISSSEENLNKVIQQIRKYRPKIIFAPYFNDRHPDHEEASKLVKRAMFFTGLPKIKTTYEGKEQEAYRPKKLFYFVLSYDFEPSFISDISETFETKMKTIRAYQTQFHIEGKKTEEPETFISSPEFVQFLEARAKMLGFKIGKKYGEPFFCEEQVELDLINYLEKL